MPTLYFSKEYKTLVEELCTKSVQPELGEIFPLYRDLMLFAAMTGKRYDRKSARKGNGGEVESNYFKSTGFKKEGVVYLLGLLENDDPSVLKDGASDCWKLFEQYCNGGMEIISGWLKATESTEQYAQILQKKILDQARQSKKVPVTVKRPRLRHVT